MRKGPFSGITILDPGEPLSTDSGAALGRDRETIDRLLQIGTKTHRHDGSDGLANPTVAPSVSVEESGGSIASDLAITVGYTFEDALGGETRLSPVTVVSTAPPLDAPTGTLVATVDYTAGSLLVGTYYYGITHLDGEGGETPLGAVVSVDRLPGQTNGRVLLSGLTDAIGGAAGYRLYRAVNGGSFHFLTEGDDQTDEFVDDGSTEPDCAIHPPTIGGNTTGSTSALKVELPVAPEGAEFINVYASVSGSFGGASLLDAFPATDGGTEKTFTALQFTNASPPATNLSIGGAQKIDARTDIDHLAWGQPVATADDLPGTGEDGEVRLVVDGPVFHRFDAAASAWFEIETGAPLAVVEDASGGLAVEPTGIRFEGASGAEVHVSDLGAGSALVTVVAPPSSGGSIEEVSDDASGVVVGPSKLKFIGEDGAVITVTENAGTAEVTLSAAALQGDPGEPGADGEDGRTILSGSGAPDSGTGADVDFYLDLNTYQLYGPKTSGSWGSPYSLVGLPGGTLDGLRVTDGSTAIDSVAELTLDGLTLTDHGAGSGTIHVSAPGPSARETLSDSTGSIAPDASGAIDLDAYAGQRIIGLEVSHAANVRVYGHPDHRVEDAGREVGETPGAPVKVLLDYITDASGFYVVSPAVDAHNLENPVDDKLYLAVWNQEDAGSAVIDVDLLVQKTEAA